ncbi:hypothetical protein [Chengkuizengella axinellae]|uniref:Uncharacterized protein n=1 Tax=Chengkuizengella axinellae TaxID=3064388 RepID=A0ABT9J272_9BACL|nr:hypothetical protein [Chengkuizengella sp. 2205SS18-9]MDP5275707.1 hypothetical protein [Chengkuizengella sp. 2205SS18-9]
MKKVVIASGIAIALIGGVAVSNLAMNDSGVTLSETEEAGKTEENPILRKDLENFDEIMTEQMSKFKGLNDESMYNLLNHTFENTEWTFESDDYNMMLFHGTQNDKEYYIFFNYQKESISIILDGESISKSKEEFNDWLSQFAINDSEVTLSETEDVTESQENPILREDLENFDEIMTEQMSKFKGPNDESMYDLLNHTFENTEWTFESDDYNMMLFHGTQNDKEYYIFFNYQKESISIILDGESISKSKEEFNEWLSTGFLS